ncbi:TrmB family transcriptional regulator [Haloprofundus marisrubri]|uniref:TrmB family transcriptional regulator n=1 Tax=Haloprofundus marisrubri TaxID=1514971 RepID=A0A0W1RAL8_9EURY|nr:TrmB family transcriptional regulator [Haloprofundus marisrubri]KTG10130.1 TrmB family transcriptional regulator [Haloprofundus marisrubri]
MDTAELRRALEDAELSQYQADAYTALLRLGSASATELADACSVPTARIYDVLRDLETKGYIETYEQDSLHARANDPQAVLGALRGKAERFTDAATEIEERWEQPAVDDHMVSIVKRFETVFDRACDIVRDAEREVQVSASPEQFKRLRPALSAAYDDGVLVSVSIHTDSDTPADALPDPKTYEGVATEVRHRRLPAPFIVLVDRNRMCFTPHARSVNRYGVLVDDYTLTYVFHWFFQTCLWEVWETVYDARPTEPPLVYTDIRRFVRETEPLLIDGATVRVRVDGYDTDSGKSVSFVGTLEDVSYVGSSTNGEPPLSQLAGETALTVDVDGETRTVGGWGAVVEDIEANRLTVESVSE